MQTISNAEDLARLKAQDAKIESVFAGAGFTVVNPSIIQPADPFLELSGEDIRRRTYVFSDPYGNELCLRPDLTIPTCRTYLDRRASSSDAIGRLYYAGPAFRCQKPGSNRPTEFPQTGLELIGSPNSAEDDAEVFNLTLKACQQAGLEGGEIKMGDLGLFAALINALDIPEQWRTRIKQSFWRPRDFSKLLVHLSSETHEASGLLKILWQLGEGEAESAIADLLHLSGAEPIGGRTVQDITDRLLSKAFDAQADALPDDIVALINDYLAIAGSPKAALQRISALVSNHQLNLTAGLSDLEKRFDLIEQQGSETDTLVFATEFGRNLEYYTGFVFEITHAGLGSDVQIAGGGRYDNLLSQLGADGDIPAVGAMIRGDRLLAAVALGKEGAGE
jgi:ATP phosphoribosyltransferase regulatory subunit